MQVNSVQPSTTFGQFWPAPAGRLAEAYEKMPCDKWKGFNSAREAAKSALDKTELAHLQERVDSDGKIIYDMVQWIPKLVYVNQKPAIITDSVKTPCDNKDLPAIVQEVLHKDGSLMSMMKVKQEQLDSINKDWSKP